MAERTVAVFGAGAVGGYLAGRLGLSPNRPAITLIGRSRMVEAVRSHGLILREADGETVSHPAATASADELEPIDLVLYAVRTFDVRSTIDSVRPLLGKDGLLLALQNGVGTEEELVAALGRDRVLAGTLTVSAGMEEPGVITRYSRRGGVALAGMNGSPPQWVIDLFLGTGLPAVTVGDYRSLRWSKLLLNMLAGATSAILDMDIGALVANPDVFRLEQLAFREAGRVMDAQGIKTVALPGYPVPLARKLMRLPRPLAQQTLGRRLASARGGRSPGMRADMARNRTEVGSFNGAVVETASRLSLPAPANAVLAELTAELAVHPEQRAEYAGKPDALAAYARRRGVRL